MGVQVPTPAPAILSNNVCAHPQPNPLQQRWAASAAQLGTLTCPIQLCNSIKIKLQNRTGGRLFCSPRQKSAQCEHTFKEFGHHCHQFNPEKLQKLSYTTLQFFRLALARFEEKDYFSAIFCPSSNILHSRTGTPSSCKCYIRYQLLRCQFHITISHLSGTLCNQQARGSRGNLTFFQQHKHPDNILLLLESTVQRHSACTQVDLLVLGQHSLTRADLAPAYSTQLPGELQSSGAGVAAGTGTGKEITKCQETPAAPTEQRCCYSSYYQLPPVSSS